MVVSARQFVEYVACDLGAARRGDADSMNLCSRGVIAAAAVALSSSSAALAGPWAWVGDADLRSDVEVLASAGVVDNVTMQWPIPWAGLLDRVTTSDALVDQPDFVRAAAERLRTRGMDETKPGKLNAFITLDATNSPAVVRGFDALGREDVQSEIAAEYVWKRTAVHLNVGVQTSDRHDHQALVFDGSYIAQRVDDIVVYAGYMPHWWGPGWISGMSLSTNARPVPQVGFSRISTAPSHWLLLNWLGAWQFEFFVGLLDGPSTVPNTVYDGMRFAFSPIRHFEVAISRTDMMCGKGQPCKPIAEYFDFRNDQHSVNKVNDQGSIEFRYSNMFDGISYAVYTQAMNEDNNPLINSGTSHLFGASVWAPVADGTGRLTLEYADSLATKDLWGEGVIHGFTYNSAQYPDGMRHRTRSLGFSLDSNSRLFSVQANYIDGRSRSYTLTYHHADISHPLNTRGNLVSNVPVTINCLQARVNFPLVFEDRHLRLSIDGRLQDDQPRPDKGFEAAVEAALTVGL